MPEGGALKKKTDEGISRTDAIHAAYERGQADKIFTEFLDKQVSPTRSGLMITPRNALVVERNWRNLLGKVDDLLKDKVYQKEFLAHLKKSIEGSMKEEPPDNGMISEIVKKLGETKTYTNLPAKFRQSDHDEVRGAIAKAIRYNLEHSPNFEWNERNKEKARGILEEFGVPSEANVIEAEKTFKTGRIFKHTHTEPVIEHRDFSVKQRLEMFERSQF
jgi:hypothetical protein